MSETIAVLNAGSSSIKFALYSEGPQQPAAFRGQVEGIGTAPRLSIKHGPRGRSITRKRRRRFSNIRHGCWTEPGSPRSGTGLFTAALISLLRYGSTTR